MTLGNSPHIFDILIQRTEHIAQLLLLELTPESEDDHIEVIETLDLIREVYGATITPAEYNAARLSDYEELQLIIKNLRQARDLVKGTASKIGIVINTPKYRAD